MNTHPSALQASPACTGNKAPVDTVALNTKNLFPGGSRERTIVHGNTEYRLRITTLGKLILTK